MNWVNNWILAGDFDKAKKPLESGDFIVAASIFTSYGATGNASAI